MDEIRCAIKVGNDRSRTSPGRIVGELITYGQRAKDRPEVFEAGALSWDASGIVLNRMHRRKSPITRFVPEARDGKVLINARLPDTQAGRDAAQEIRSGLFTGLSIEFRALAEGVSGGVRHIRKAMLGGAALVDSPSYSTTVEVRSKGRATARRALLWL